MDLLKNLLNTIIATDKILDSDPKIENISNKILTNLIKQTNSEKGSMFLYNRNKKQMRLISKKTNFNSESVKKCYKGKKIIYEKNKIYFPILMNKEILGVMFLYGNNFSPESLIYLTSISEILNGRFKREINSKNLKEIFNKYVGEKTMTKLLSDPDEAHFRGERRKASVLFADINKFTEYINSERYPQRAINFLNTFFEEMSKIVISLEGTVDKFIGDEIMVVFGSPIPQKDHAKRAVKAAKQMIKIGNKIIKKYKLKDSGISIGITSGNVIAGTIGSEKLSDYTVIGKRVNLASRLTSLAEKNEILIDEETKKEIGLHKLEEKEIGNIKGFPKLKVFKLT